MTKQRYVSMSCAAGSQESGLASPDASARSDLAWNVNLNNGNSNRNNQNNKGLLLVCRSASASEYQGDVSFRELFVALQHARHCKVPSANQLAFDANWIDGLLRIEEELKAGIWQPGSTTCFIAKRPKARQIHAPDFADRVVHHWLVHKLEAIFDPGFIFDSYANRKGKGTHAAVDRLRSFVRQVHSGEAGGWYLQLDVRNFFNSIHRPTLWRILKRRLERTQATDIVLRTTHALLRSAVDPSHIVHRSTAAERACVPPHKRLENAAPGCGLPIGNLSSQFFANVYLDRLDQFVKHELKAQRYLRYVDDFVIVHHNRAELEYWQRAIEQFLRDELRLQLKDDIRLRPLANGIDFLGYIVYPTHTRVRQRVVKHAFGSIRKLRELPPDRRADRLRAIVASYVGHFSHANAQQLTEDFYRAASGAAKECSS